MATIRTESIQDLPLVTLTGRLDSTNFNDLGTVLQSMAEEHTFLLLNMSECSYLSSAGIRVLLMTAKRLQAAGGGLHLFSLPAAVFQILEMAGLHNVLQLFDSKESALAAIEKIRGEKQLSHNWKAGSHSYHFQPMTSERTAARIWTNQGIAGYDELGFSIGTGSAAETPEELEQALGFFVTCRNCAGFIPNDPLLASDFRIPRNPAAAGIFIDRAISFGSQPIGWVRQEGSGSLTLRELADALYPVKFQLSSHVSDPMALLIADRSNETPSLTFCLLVDRAMSDALRPTGLNQIPGLVRPGEPGIHLWGARFVLDTVADLTNPADLPGFLQETVNLVNVTNVAFIHPDDRVTDPVTWLFLANGTADVSDIRIRIETEGDVPFESYKAFLARRLYTDSSRVIIKPLHGGYSAQTFQVTSFDQHNRKMRPTVMKIANRAIINRESERCRKYALPYILNNSAQVLGTEFFGDIGALRYNFVGIGGQQSQLKWLAHYFEEWPVEKLNPLFDKIFLQILDPWYGQPIQEAIYPYRDHDPTLTFFRDLCERAEELFNISADDPQAFIEETGQQIVNPYWFLRHEFPRMRESSIDYFTSICHGDLNMQNILLDEDMNVYLIDFSETKPRSQISDFARLEAIFMIQHAAITQLDEIENYVRFLAQFYAGLDLASPPQVPYEGPDREQIEKNVSMTIKMRKYAFDAVQGNPDPVPYCLALLEWVLPVVCYSGPAAWTRYSMVIAGLLCQIVAASGE